MVSQQGAKSRLLWSVAVAATPAECRFIESLDPARYTGEKLAGPIGHAFSEIVIAMLFGERVVVPEAYATDSVGFLELAPLVLEARGRARLRDRST